jgi:hypothetical protein
MRITLETYMPSNGKPSTPQESWCVRQIKRGLNRLGYYMPTSGEGITDEVDDNILDSLRAFQLAYTIPAGDRVGPGSLTERVLNEEIDRQNPDALYTWKTVGDKKVREGHAERSGRRFFWGDDLEGGHPGEDYNCRCWAEPLNPALHPWAQWARKRAEERRKERLDQISFSGRLGVPIPSSPENKFLQNAGAAAEILWNGARITVTACWANAACRAWMIREGTKIILENHIPAPDTLPAYPDAKKAPTRGQRKRWVDSKGRIYEWDYKKGEVEIYDKTGKNHQGGFDPKTGKQTSKPVPGRKVEK